MHTYMHTQSNRQSFYCFSLAKIPLTIADVQTSKTEKRVTSFQMQLLRPRCIRKAQ